MKISPLPSVRRCSLRPCSSGRGVFALLLLACLLGTALPSHAQSTSGLVLWLKANDGVATNLDGTVSDWADASLNLNDAAQHTAGLAPLLVPNAINGQPALRFDGVDDYLEIANSATLQPGTSDWTVFVVAKRLAASQGDFPQIIGSRPWTAGLDKGWAVAYSGGGVIGSHYADGASGHDAPAILAAAPLSQASFQLWQVEENRAAGTTAFYLNGDLNRSVSSSMPAGAIDQADAIYIGRDIGGANNRRANMDLAEVLVYNRVLSRVERDEIATYLSGKYNFGFTLNTAPTVAITSPAEGSSFAVPATFNFTATAADVDGSIRQVDFLFGSTRVATATQPPFSVSVKISTPGALVLTAAATDNRGERVVSAPVNITVTGSGAPSLTVSNELRLWLAADAGVATGGGGEVTDWADQSPNLNDAAQRTAGEEPLLVSNAINGKPALRFDGADDYLEIPNSASLQPLSGDWTVFFVGQRRPGSQGDFPQIIGSRPWIAGLDKGWSVSMDGSGLVASHYADGSTGHDVPQVRAASALSLSSAQVWQVEENRTAGRTKFFAGGVLDRSTSTAMPSGTIDQADPIRIGREIGGANNRRASMDLAEVLVYGNALGDADRESVTVYLSSKYGLTLADSQNPAPTVAITAPLNGANFIVPTNITLSATAADDGSVAAVQFFRGATLIGTVSAPPYDLSVSNGNPGSITYTAVAIDNLGASMVSAAITITNATLNPPTPAPIDTTRGLISLVDYEDTFTVGTTARADGLYNNNGAGGYNIETAQSNPDATWTPFSNFSFNSGQGTTCCGYPGNGSNAGAAGGVAQSGGGDFSIAYGLRQSYVVSVDAIIPGDRLDISSMPGAGATIFSAGSISVFFRKSPGSIGIFNGAAETPSGVQTGVTDSDWHNYAVHFDKPHNRLGIYVDGVLKTNLDLTTFASGAYLDYSNNAVGLGGAGGVFWADNFKVGAAGRLLRSIDFSDSFTVGTPARADGLYNNNATGGYNVESDPSRTWLPFSNFSLNSGGISTCCGYPGNTGNDGAMSGLAQSGGGDFSFEYGTRQSYVVEVDAIIPGDRFDIGSVPNAGAGLFGGNRLFVFLRKDGAATGIGLFNGSAEANTGATTGVSDSHWHRYAVHFDKANDRLLIYVDRQLRANIDLNTFGGGAYRNYSNAAMSLGGAGGVFWSDNFQVGPPEFELNSRVDIVRTGANATVSWTGAGVLQEATDITGPWTNIGAARSPYTAPGAGAKFFRLKR